MSQPAQHLLFPGKNDDPPVGGYAQPSYSSSNWSPPGGQLFRAIWVSVAGNVYVIGNDDTLGVFTNVPVGLWSIGGKFIVAANDGTHPTTATIDTAILST